MINVKVEREYYGIDIGIINGVGQAVEDLTKLCLKDNNLVLVYDLNEAMFRARVSLRRS